jgi:dCMP deaminase
MKRISFEKMAMNFAIQAAQRSEDLYKKVGACILNKDGRILSIGYNGLLPKQKLPKSFWDNRDSRRAYMIHAETNALSCITRYDNPFLLASTLLPCSSCATNIASYGIKKIIYIEDYAKDKSAIDIFKFYNIQLFRYNI